MLSSTEKTVILAGTLFGSVYLFSTALYSINKITSTRYNNSTSDSDNNKLIAINGLTMLFSGLTFSYFTYKAIK
jgi:nitrate reductase gamma subunit